MLAIPSFMPTGGSLLGQSVGQSGQMAGTSSFDALLASFNTDSQSADSGSAIDILDANIAPGFGGDTSLSALTDMSGTDGPSSLNDMFNTILAQNKTPDTYPLSSDFLSTFGGTGPLPDYINMITAALHLSAQQNQSLQNISVENKDTTGSVADIQKIADELQQAGIG